MSERDQERDQEREKFAEEIRIEIEKSVTNILLNPEELKTLESKIAELMPHLKVTPNPNDPTLFEVESGLNYRLRITGDELVMLASVIDLAKLVAISTTGFFRDSSPPEPLAP